jgi:hypothetical protein
MIVSVFVILDISFIEKSSPILALYAPYNNHQKSHKNNIEALT